MMRPRVAFLSIPPQEAVTHNVTHTDKEYEKEKKVADVTLSSTVVKCYSAKNPHNRLNNKPR